jgi:plastocyanin
MRIWATPFCLPLLLIAQLTTAAAPTTQPAASISGKISASADIPNIEMVVYLIPAEGTAALPPPATPVKVSQRGAKFSPALAIITVGQQVDFVNDEERLIEHNVFSNAPPKRFDLGMYPPGQSRSVVFDKPGAVLLYCSIHRYMDGVVFVTPSGLFSRVAPDGTYRIDNVPDGKWTLSTWQRRKRFKEISMPVQIEQGKSMAIDLELKK